MLDHGAGSGSLEFEHHLHDPVEQRNITVDPDREVQIRELGAATEQLASIRDWV